ncbi:hypothetical protein DINM_002028 [Dirofilaria immitis]|nr:hypothetical protein [Dirofilaria immitis]
MSGHTTFALLINSSIIILTLQDLSLNLDDIVVYAKPVINVSASRCALNTAPLHPYSIPDTGDIWSPRRDAIELSKIDQIDNEDLEMNCGRMRRQWLSTPYKISIGSAAKIGQFPWAVALTFLNRKHYNYCGGSIISKRHILTAAHCVMQYEGVQLPCINATTMDDITEIVIRYGGVCLRSESPQCDGKLCMTAKIRKIALHRRFMDEGCVHGYDFAIIELEADLMFDTSTSAICLPHLNFNLTSAENLLDYGFGENETITVSNDNSNNNNNNNNNNSNNSNNKKLTYGRSTITTRTVTHFPCDLLRYLGDSGAGLQGFVKHRIFLLGIHSFGPKIVMMGRPLRLPILDDMLN